MIEIKQDDVVYKLPQETTNLQNIQIPNNATVFDATDCRNFYDLKGLKEYSNLRVLLLKNTAVESLDFCYIPENVEEIDLRNCRFVSSFMRFPERNGKTLHVLSHFSGERILKQIPPHVDLELDGFFSRISHHKQLTLDNDQKIHE